MSFWPQGLWRTARTLLRPPSWPATYQSLESPVCKPSSTGHSFFLIHAARFHQAHRIASHRIRIVCRLLVKRALLLSCRVQIPTLTRSPTPRVVESAQQGESDVLSLRIPKQRQSATKRSLAHTRTTTARKRKRLNQPYIANHHKGRRRRGTKKKKQRETRKEGRQRAALQFFFVITALLSHPPSSQELRRGSGPSSSAFALPHSRSVLLSIAYATISEFRLRRRRPLLPSLIPFIQLSLSLCDHIKSTKLLTQGSSCCCCCYCCCRRRRRRRRRHCVATRKQLIQATLWSPSISPCIAVIIIVVTLSPPHLLVWMELG